MSKSVIFALILFFSIPSLGQNIFTINPDFVSSTKGWACYGNSTIVHLKDGAKTPGSLKLIVDSTNNSASNAGIYSAFMPIPDSLSGKLLFLSFWAKAPFHKHPIRVEIVTKNSASTFAIQRSLNYSLDSNFREIYFPAKLSAADSVFSVNIQCGADTGTYIFDDFSFCYEPTPVNKIKLFSLWKPKIFHKPKKIIWQTLQPADSTVQITVFPDTITKILPTQIGVNANFRSKNSIVQRWKLYRPFGAFRYPAGSGSDLYFWDGNIPDTFAIRIQPYSGTSKQFTDNKHFIMLLDSVHGQGDIVVNYFFARYGITPDNSRASKVLQAANYAANWVDFMNNKNNAHIKFWEIGNECYGWWETGYNVNGNIVTGTEYGQDFNVFNKQMRQKDPSILTGLVLSYNDFDWDSQALQNLKADSTFLILHQYFNDISTAQKSKAAAHSFVQNAKIIEQFAHHFTHKSFGYFPLALTEFNSRGDYTTNIANALFIAEALGQIMLSHISLATVWVNEWRINGYFTHGIIALDDPDQPDYTPRPDYTPFYFYHFFFGDKMLRSSISDSSLFSAYASSFSSGQIAIVIINYSDTSHLFSLRYPGQSNNDTIFWYSVYAQNKKIGNKKFYINHLTSHYKGGGPFPIDSVPAFGAILSPQKSILLPKFSINFLVIQKARYKNNTSASKNIISIFPNPASKIITIRTQNLNFTDIQWFNVKGQKINPPHILSSGTNTASFNISSLPNGIYIIKIQNHSAKFIKI